MENLAPTPDFLVEQPVTNNRITGRVTQAMRYWLLSLADRVNACPQLLSTVAVTGKTAAISATSFDILSVAPGVYRLSMAARITRAASTSSSLIVTFVFAPDLLRLTTITYATSYASSGGTTMQYRIDVMCEQVV